MCGIAGYVSPNVPPAERELAVSRMCASMVHRGPDDDGWVTHGPATLGMRRLAIFDPAHGHQPMATADGRYTIVFNGSIYNHLGLRAQLEAEQFVFRTRCDTEVLLAAYVRWGASCLPRLRGMFAFAVWDSQENKLFLARDALGIKPLYLHAAEQTLLFASEVNALLSSGAVPGDVDPTAVLDYLGWLAVPAPRTIRKRITSLQPGQFARFHSGGLEIQTWWSLRDAGRGERACGDREGFLRELRVRLEDTIQAHMLADVPVGAFLSGGLDSTIIAALMTRAGSKRLRTFSLGFSEGEFSEAGPAAETARFLGTEHHEFILTGDQVAADMGRILGAMDQPTGDGINTYYVSQCARQGGVTAALSGLGGDEVFGGYPSFRSLPHLCRWLPLWRSLPKPVRRLITGRLSTGGTRSRKLADLLRHAHTPHELASLQRRVFSEPGRIALLSRDLRRDLQARGPFHPMLDTLAADLGEVDSFALASGWEMRTYMTDVLLRDSDVMSMRHSLELRVPFVDRPLIDWFWRQPEAFKRGGRQPKSCLAEAVADVLPPGVASRPKRGFTLPFALWTRRELRPFLEDTFSPESIGRTGFFSTDTVGAYWRRYVEGSDPRDWSRVWSLAILIAHLNRSHTSLTA